MFGDRQRLWSGRLGGILAAVFGFACLFVFPAIPIGHTVGVDPALALTLLLVLLHPSVLGPSLGFLTLSMLPLLASMLAWLAFGQVFAPALMPKAIVAYFLSVVPFVGAREVVRAGRLRQMLIGVALGTVVHAGLAVYQIHAFDLGEIPFLDLMATNPGMALPTETAKAYAEYIRRPFGLFAEPSAMAACVGPWLVLMIGLISGKVGSHPRVHRALWGLALAAGCFLLAVSQSGQAPIVVLGMAAAFWATRKRPDDASAASARRWVAPLVMLAVIVVTAVVYALLTQGSLEEHAESSWVRRFTSFTFVGKTLSEGVLSFLFGVGPGQPYAMLDANVRFARTLPPEVTYVWSVPGAYVSETGVFGLACLGAVAYVMASSIWSSSERVFGIACAVVWFAGILLATSYAQQPSIWFFLAVLIEWKGQIGERDFAPVRRQPLRALLETR